MRDAFHEALDTLSDDLVDMTRLAASAMAKATTALLDADLGLAESVIAGDEQIDKRQHDLEARAIDLLARQQPVATDLRIVVTALRMGADLERMGDLARHVAQVARMRSPESAIPATMRPTIIQMDKVAEAIVSKTGSVIAAKSVQDALQIERDDDEMDRLHRELYGQLLDGSWSGNVEEAIDVTLIGRYYERYADHAVAVARRVVFLVTGQYAPAPAAAGR